MSARRRLPVGVAAALLPAALAASACAREGQPPGGPEDRTPPVVAATQPEPFAVEEGFRGPVLIHFSERISERPGRGRLEDAVRVSPFTGDVRVRHRRDGLAITIEGGFRPGLVYGVTILPVIRDMFGNPLLDDFQFFFSTGAEFHPTVLGGEVTDRITGRPVEGMRVDAVAVEGGLIHTARTDTAGFFVLRYVPPGGYSLRAYDDLDRNGRPDPYERQNGRRIEIGTPVDTMLESLAILEPDTTAARLSDVEIRDSLTLRLTFSDYIDPDEALDGVGVALHSLDGDTARASSVVHEHEWDEMRNREPAPEGEEQAADPPPPLDPAEEDGPTGAVLPKRTLVALLERPLVPGVTYNVVVSGVRNIGGVPEGGGSRILEVPPAKKTDSTDVGRPQRAGR